MSLRLDTAHLVGVMIESALFGVYFVSFPVMLYVLIGTKRSGDSRKPIDLIMAAISVVLFILTCANWALDMDRLYQAFIASQIGPRTFLNTMWGTREVARISLYIAQIVTFDGVLLFRTYIIWGRNLWVTVVPAITFTGTIVSGIGSIVYTHSTRTPPWLDKIIYLTLKLWVTTAYVLNFITNFICLGLISFRLVQQHHRLRASGVAQLGGSKLIRIVVIIVESASLYSLTNLATICAFLAPSNALFIVTSIAPPITAISFALIVLRVGFERAFSSWLGPPAAPSGSGMTSALRTPGGEHPVRITCESTFVDSDVDKDKDRESVEVKRPTLRGRANVSEAVV